MSGASKTGNLVPNNPVDTTEQQPKKRRRQKSKNNKNTSDKDNKKIPTSTPLRDHKNMNTDSLSQISFMSQLSQDTEMSQHLMNSPNPPIQMQNMQNAQPNMCTYPQGTPNIQSMASHGQFTPPWAIQLFNQVENINKKLTTLDEIYSTVNNIKCQISAVETETKRLDTKIKEIEKSSSAISGFF